MDAVLFDVDDTLYDQREPFERAFRQLFGETYEIDMERLFALSRKYSDEAFEHSRRFQRVFQYSRKTDCCSGKYERKPDFENNGA